MATYPPTDPRELDNLAGWSGPVEGRVQFHRLKRGEFVMLLGGAATTWASI
jgi:hypothetical protein